MPMPEDTLPESPKQPKSFVPILVFCFVFLLAVFGGVSLYKNSQNQALPTETSPSTSTLETVSNYPIQTNNHADWPALWGPAGAQCQNNTSVEFSSSPVALADIDFVEPMGELKEGHIVPGDHIGIDYKTSPTSKPVKVYAPADGTLVMVEKHPYSPPVGYPRNMKHYHIYMMHSCTLFTGIVHLTEFDPSFLNTSPELQKLDAEVVTQYKNSLVNAPIKAGQLLGTTWSFGLLGMVTVDLNKTNSGYLNPVSYKGENWRVHSVSPFEYFTPSLKGQILTKNPRVSEPRGGKIDFDIEGKLVGSWFQEGSGGFRDESVAPKQCGNFPCPYWDGHIAFVYDYIEPTQLRVSIGHDWGLSRKTPFGVKSNGPDFKSIGTTEGLLKYELTGLKDLSREKGYISDDALIEVSDESKFLGTILVQMLDKDSLKVEVFPAKSKSQVTSFTSNARIYQR